MHGFGPSRGRIFFETLCALTISASLVGAWMQTGASALLAAAGVAALYGLVHPFGRKGRQVALTKLEEPAREVAGRIELIDVREVEAQQPADQGSVTDEVGDQLEPVEPVAPKAPVPRAKAPRKGGARRANPPKKARAIELVPVVEAEVADIPRPDEAERAEFMSAEDASHAHIEPLFEPAPFVRMPHRAFGRKAG